MNIKNIKSIEYYKSYFKNKKEELDNMNLKNKKILEDFISSISKDILNKYKFNSINKNQFQIDLLLSAKFSINVFIRIKNKVSKLKNVTLSIYSNDEYEEKDINKLSSDLLIAKNIISFFNNNPDRLIKFYKQYHHTHFSMDKIIHILATEKEIIGIAKNKKIIDKFHQLFSYQSDLKEICNTEDLSSLLNNENQFKFNTVSFNNNSLYTFDYVIKKDKFNKFSIEPTINTKRNESEYFQYICDFVNEALIFNGKHILDIQKFLNINQSDNKYISEISYIDLDLKLTQILKKRKINKF